MTNKTNLLDQAAEILAGYIDDMSTRAAEVFLSRGAPFAADISNDDKLAYYRAQLFNPDGSPNYAGRMAQIERLGPEGFARMFKQVTGVSRGEEVA